jgi:hypothetical protein
MEELELIGRVKNCTLSRMNIGAKKIFKRLQLIIRYLAIGNKKTLNLGLCIRK